MKTRPLRIAVSARIQHGDTSKPGYLKKRVYYIEQSYVQYVAAHGAMPFLVPDLAGPRATGLSLADYVRDLDGLMMQGGADLSPRLYGEAPQQPEWAGDPVRDRYELELLQRFIDAGKPVLGICRGHQLLNVALGGSLYQDIETQVPGGRRHADLSVYDDHFHEIAIEPESGLARLYPGARAARVNSLHHQSVKRLGHGLRVEARSVDDGVVEAVRHAGGPYLVGVQWHPEFLGPADPGLLDGSPLLEEFLGAARRQAG